MNENELNSTQTFALLGVACIASAVAVGLVIRKLQAKNKTVHPFGSGKTITEIATEL